MKKTIVPLLLVSSLLVGCETTQPSKVEAPTVPEFVYTTGPQKEGKSDIKHYEVFQVIDRGSLAFKCQRGPDFPCTGFVVLIPRSVVAKPWDGMVIALKNTKVIDTYTYETREKLTKTVPIVTGKTQ